jgi:hypothetical protein
MRRLCLVEPGGMSYLHTKYITIGIEVNFNRLETIYSLCSRNAYTLAAERQDPDSLIGPRHKNPRKK